MRVTSNSWILSFGGAFLVLMALPAQARPRDEVMSGAFRCAAIGDSRTWLNCYYGAAQPARAALGIKPAPAAQIALAASPPAGNPGDVSVRDAVMAAASRCNGFAEDRPWLDCYYAAAQPMRSMLGLAPAAQAAPVPPASTAPLGGPLVPPAQPAMASGVHPVASRMAAYSFDKFGLFTATLENGQVWRQVDGDTDLAHWKKSPSSYWVRVSPGFMGSFSLQVKDNPGLFKVLRTQ